MRSQRVAALTEDMSIVEPRASILREKPAPAGAGVLLAVLFAVYLVLLAWVVLFKLEIPHVGSAGVRPVKLVPFVSDGVNGASAPSEVVANLVLFVPFGLYLRLVAPSWPRWKAVGVVAASSLALESAQYVLAVGSADVTDLVVNTAGGLIGLGLFAVLYRRLRGRTVRVVARVCLIGTGLALLASGILFFSPLHYAQRDVTVPLHGEPGSTTPWSDGARSAISEPQVVVQ